MTKKNNFLKVVNEYWSIITWVVSAVMACGVLIYTVHEHSSILKAHSNWLMRNSQQIQEVCVKCARIEGKDGR